MHPFVGEGPAFDTGFGSDNARSGRRLPWSGLCDEWSTILCRAPAANPTWANLRRFPALTSATKRAGGSLRRPSSFRL